MAVIGVPDEKWGEKVTAVVVLHNEYEPSGEELAAGDSASFAKGKIAGFKRPKQIDFIKDEDMPRTGHGQDRPPGASDQVRPLGRQVVGRW